MQALEFLKKAEPPEDHVAHHADIERLARLRADAHEVEYWSTDAVRRAAREVAEAAVAVRLLSAHHPASPDAATWELTRRSRDLLDEAVSECREAARDELGLT